jgi:2-amino-4-hydroxy-6-hydroxymethyldihydropteridine diphosphokinase
MALVAIALGSNLGDRRAHLAWAVERLGRVLDGLRMSAVLETEPVDVPGPQPPYLNAVVVGETTLDPVALFRELAAIERQRGRARPSLRAPRTLDLDMILYDDQVLRTGDLEVPHPRFRDRPFVLEPLAELEPGWVDPVSGREIRELLEELRASDLKLRTAR